MSDATTSGTSATPTAPVAIPDALFNRAFEEAMRLVAAARRKRPAFAEAFHDAAVDALMWARTNCRDPDTFAAFAHRAVKTWLFRTVSRQLAKKDRRPDHVRLTPDIANRKALKSARLTLHPDLPEELGFTLRLYTIDGFTLREIGLLTGVSPNTADMRLKRAAALLHDGPTCPPIRRNGEKRLTAG